MAGMFSAPITDPIHKTTDKVWVMQKQPNNNKKTTPFYKPHLILQSPETEVIQVPRFNKSELFKQIGFV